MAGEIELLTTRALVNVVGTNSGGLASKAPLAVSSAGVVAVASGGVDQDEWLAYTPTVSATAGTFTTVVGAVGRWKRLTAKTVAFTVEAQVTDIGTGSGGLQFTLPVTSKAGGVPLQCFGKEQAVTGNWVNGSIAASSPFITCYYEGNASVIVNNCKVNINGIYETD